MTDNQTFALILKNQEGDYFVLPQELVEQRRVPEERRAEIEQLLAEQPDTQGHFFWIPFFVALAGGSAIVGGTALIIDEATKDSGRDNVGNKI